MASNVANESSDDDIVKNNESDSDFSDWDMTLLENAEDVMAKISPQKVTKTPATKKARQQKIKKPLLKKKKLTKQLTKAEIQELTQYLENSKQEITEKVSLDITAKTFWDCHSGYRESLSLCMSQSNFSLLVNSICADFRQLYTKNSKGSTKYDNLQLDWFQNSDKYMRSNDGDHPIFKDLDTETVKDHTHFKSCVISNLHTLIFAKSCSLIIEFLVKKRSSDQTKEKEVFSPDEDFALYRMHGWILPEMEKHANSKTCSLSEEKKSLWLEVKHSLVCKDKSTLPSKLHHHDKGTKQGMTFPTQEMLPFMRLSDVTFKEFTSEENQQKFGNNIANIVKLQMHAHVGMKHTFSEAVNKLCTKDCDSIMDKVFTFWIEKLSNMRINDTLLVGNQKLELAETKEITGDTCMLRDNLKPLHTKGK